jgi:hypothetical protein
VYNEAPNGGCQCELCRPNYYMGWDGEVVPEQPDALPVKQDEKETPVAIELIPAMAN